ncbi:hypothetical protein LOZ55_003345 [Ophidiomyces ophidiicola]|nr:hypothetical protein LOZ55_003345 [Ophidiomyces ophidiicola]KAI2079400.1 hypothetical protein LOZ36_006707 [Ophidiomyces ophidiicola]
MAQNSIHMVAGPSSGALPILLDKNLCSLNDISQQGIISNHSELSPNDLSEPEPSSYFETACDTLVDSRESYDFFQTGHHANYCGSNQRGISSNIFLEPPFQGFKECFQVANTDDEELKLQITPTRAGHNAVIQGLPAGVGALDADEKIVLTFTSAAEANSFAPQKWPNALVDATIPQTQIEREAIVRDLMMSMYDLSNSKDNDGMLRPWRERRYCFQRVEIACWNILAACIERHQNGPLRQSWELKDSKPDNIGTFAERISIILQILRERKTICKRLLDVPFFLNFIDDPNYQENRVEQNKGLNAKKGVVIKAGKDALEKEEKESGRVPLEEKKRQKKSDSPTIKSDPAAPSTGKRKRKSGLKTQTREAVKIRPSCETPCSMPFNSLNSAHHSNLFALQATPTLNSNTVGYVQTLGTELLHSNTSSHYFPALEYARHPINFSREDSSVIDLAKTMTSHNFHGLGTPISGPSQTSSPTANQFFAPMNSALNGYMRGPQSHGIQTPWYPITDQIADISSPSSQFKSSQFPTAGNHILNIAQPVNQPYFQYPQHLEGKLLDNFTPGPSINSAFQQHPAFQTPCYPLQNFSGVNTLHNFSINPIEANSGAQQPSNESFRHGPMDKRSHENTPEPST